MRDLEEARKTVQETDAQMAELFQKRMSAVKDISAFKKERGLPVFDAVQEKKVLERNSALITDEMIKPYYLTLCRMCGGFQKYQERLISGAKVAFAERWSLCPLRQAIFRRPAYPSLF